MKHIIPIILCLVVYAWAKPAPATPLMSVPNDPKFASDGWFLGKYPYGTNAIEAWKITKGCGVIVAVIDSGCEIDHIEFKGRLWVNPKEIPGNGVDDDKNGYIDDIHGWNFGKNNANISDRKRNGHGTSVAGTLVANINNGEGLCGICPEAKLMVLKTWCRSAKAIIYATDHGAKVINMSSSSTPSKELESAIKYAAGKGVVIVTSGGNSGGKPWMKWPGVYEDVISVAGTNKEGKKDKGSSFAEWMDLAAPGRDITTPTKDGGYIVTGGTSLACPLVAGVCALMFSVKPDITPDKIRKALKKSAKPFAEPTEGCGAGIVDACGALKEITGDLKHVPAVDAGKNSAVMLSAKASLDATVLRDGLKEIKGKLVTEWIKVSGPGKVTFIDTSAVDTTASFSKSGTYVLRFTASNGKFSVADEVTIAVRESKEKVKGQRM